MPTEAISEFNISATRLGGGAFGDVYRAEAQPHGVVAAKVIDCARMSTMLGVSDWEILRQHLFAEADHLRKAEHPNVVRVFSVHYDEARERVYILTELCDGSLQSLIEDGPLPLADAKKYIRHALTGLDALHHRGMVHRDLKPGNALVKGGSCKLSDFGLVSDNLVAGYASSRGYTDHLAPEVILGRGTSARTDVWAMGLTIYRLLNGEPWYREVQLSLGIDWTDASTAAARVESLISRGNFAKRLQWMPHVPSSWRRFVNRALHDDSARRFQNGGQMLTAISTLHLPDSPSWNCEFSSDRVTWLRARGEREEVVEWIRHDERRHEYRGYSRPGSGGAGRSHTFASSNGLVPAKEAVKALQAVFDARMR